MDVAQAPLNGALRSTGHRWTVANAEEGLLDLVAPFQEVRPPLMARAATGGLLRAVVVVATPGSNLTCGHVAPMTRRSLRPAAPRGPRTARPALAQCLPYVWRRSG